MLKKLFFLILVLFMAVSVSNATEIDNVNMPDSLMCGKTNLILNGAGMRTKFMIKLYTAGLYLVQKDQDPKKIIAADEPMAIRMHIISSTVTNQRMEEAFKKGFFKVARGNIAPIKTETDKFLTIFKDSINENDIYDFIYSPNLGIEVYKNHKKLTIIDGMLFKKALFCIFLCDNSARNSLTKEMLGESKGGTF